MSLADFNKNNRGAGLKNENKESANGENEHQQPNSNENEEENSCLSTVYFERQLTSALELINYSETKKKLSNLNTNNKPMVLFRCSRCGFETIDLCLLRLHKQEHLKKQQKEADAEAFQDKISSTASSTYSINPNSSVLIELYNSLS
jgi:hypothetical protein